MNIFSFIKQHISILDVAQSYTSLKKAGSYWKGNCPFHSEKTASFTVSPHKEIFYCFGCHASGDTIGFIAKIENCSQIEAVQHIIERYNIEVPETVAREYSQATSSKDRYFELCQYVAVWAHGQLIKNQAALRYIRERGFTDTTIKQFMVGYFPAGSAAIKSLISYIQKYNVLANDLTEAHIIAQSKASLYSPFEDRILFPIKDHLGRFCGFGGRIFKQNDERPKYYNSKENTHFAKGSLLFGLDLGKSDIQRSNTVFLVEGYTDCMAMVQYGYHNTVATLGTACTSQHLKTLARYANSVYVLYDGDTAGHNAILKLTQLCWQVNMDLKVIILPAKQDPASFLAHHANLTPLIEQAQDIFAFFIDALGADFITKALPQKIELLRAILETIQPIEDTLKRDILLQKVSKLSEIPFISLKNELHHSKDPQPADKALGTQTQEPVDDPVGTTLEKRVFCAIMHNIQLCNNENIRYLIEYIPGTLGHLFQKLTQLSSLNRSIDFATFFDTLSESEKQYVSKLLVSYEGTTEMVLLNELLPQLHKQHWKQVVRDIQARLAYAKNANNQQEVQKIMRDFLILKQKIMLQPSSSKIINRG
jgi:DNA primase